MRRRISTRVACWPLIAAACQGSGAPLELAERTAELRFYDSSDDDLALRSESAVIARGVRWIGRADLRDPGVSRFSWSGSGFAARFVGTGMAVELQNDVDGLVFVRTVDGRSHAPLVTHAAHTRYTLVEGLAPGEHTVTLTRADEGQLGTTTLHALEVFAGTLIDPPDPPALLIEVVGDSVSAGYGTLGHTPLCHFSFATESVADTFSGYAAAALGAELSVIAMSGHGMFRNLDGTTRMVLPEAYVRAVTAQPHPRWRFAKHPDVIVVALGANDLSAGYDDPRIPFTRAYVGFLRTLRGAHPDAWIVCVAGPALSGEENDLSYLRDVVSRAMAQRAQAGDARIAALDLPVLANSELGCDYHPGARAHRRMGASLEALLRQLLSRDPR